jgi:hypothetical protein
MLLKRYGARVMFTNQILFRHLTFLTVGSLFKLRRVYSTNVYKRLTWAKSKCLIFVIQAMPVAYLKQSYNDTYY